MNTTLAGIFLFFVVSVVGWAIAEGKSSLDVYEKNDDEKQAEEKARSLVKKNGWHELNINDVIKTIACKGFSAI